MGACFMGFVVFMLIFASISQVMVVRRMGPTFDGSLPPLRLISTLTGGWAILGESVRSPVTWSGLFLIIGTLLAYVRAQHESKALTPAPGGATVYGCTASEAKLQVEKRDE